MMRLIPLAVASFTIFGSAGAARAQSATFEEQGLPLTLHQAQATGLGDLREESAAPMLTYEGMPASPAQLSVLTPRPRLTLRSIARKLEAAGYTEVSFGPAPEYKVHAQKDGAEVLLSVDSQTGEWQ